MAELSRRHLVVGGLAGAGASLLPGVVTEAHAATFTRYNLASVKGQAMLRKYAQAVKLMMARPKSDPLSWTFQWYTHAVPTNTTKAAEIAAIFGPSPSPNKALAQAMWNTCQGHFAAAGEPYFCPWHRAYVCAFEHIIRQVLNDPKFTLPYWNYTSAASYAVPKEFRQQNDPLWGPLFRPNRNPTSNAGQPIFAAGGSASDLSAGPAMAETQYLPSGAIQGFNQTLDFGLHGNVHVFTGNGQGMGSVPFAANDPIFWMHHCNIDRIWTSWNAAGHANPATAAWLNKTFTFAGPDGKGIKVVVKDYTNTKKCDYDYDLLIPAPLVASAAPSAASSVAAAAAPAAPLTVAKSQSGPVALGAAPVRVNLQPAVPIPPAAPGAAPAASPLSGRLSDLAGNRRIYLVISDLKANVAPETLFRVYLDLGDGPPADPVNSNYVGSFNFFAAVPHGDSSDHDHGDTSRSISFDVTDIAANLDANGRLRAEHAVTIVPAKAPTADARSVVGNISFVEQ
ncbi:MAG: tyrosinase family protein [bacterium]|nr:tyrosinase family protein [bacterium]